MKKKLLFVIDSLDMAGAEKSLVTLLTILDYQKYTVDLQLFAYDHPLEKLVPEEVTILDPLPYTNFTKLNIKSSIKVATKERKFNMLLSRVKYSTKIRQKEYNNPQKAIIYWQSASKVIDNNPKVYDVAISYAQGIPTYYVAEKVISHKKIAWVNVSYYPSKSEIEFQKKYYDQYTNIVAVSDSTREVLLEFFPSYSEKIKVVYDINHPQIISEMAKTGVGFEDSFNGIKILTIGRLAGQKGYEIALEACKKLKERGVAFRWYVLGKGPLQSEIETFIQENNLGDHFVLLGVEANPYPFIQDTDIYVQTSRFEGFGLAIAEARMLNIPVVTTRFDAVGNQMIHEKNGLIVEMNAEAVCKGIMRLINDQNLKQRIIDYLSMEKKGNSKEIEKFYQLIG